MKKIVIALFLLVQGSLFAMKKTQHIVSLRKGIAEDIQSPNFTGEEAARIIWIIEELGLGESLQRLVSGDPNRIKIFLIPNKSSRNKNVKDIEITLGSDAKSIFDKIHSQKEPSKALQPYIKLCKKLNELSCPKSWEKEILSSELADDLEGVLDLLRIYWNEPDFERVYIYALDGHQAKYLLDLYSKLMSFALKEFSQASRKKIPQMKKRASEDISKKAFAVLDKLSDNLLMNQIYFDAPKKQSKGGWHLWKSDKEGIFVAYLYAESSGVITDRKLAEAIVTIFQKFGFAAENRVNKKIDKRCILVAFDINSLEKLDVDLFCSMAHSLIESIK